MRIAALAAVVLACVAAVAQQPEESGSQTLRRIADSMKRYSRDISELPIEVEATVSQYDKHDNLKKQKTSKHTMQFIKRYVKGDRVVRQLTWKKSGFHWVLKEEANADSATSLFALLFDNGHVDDSHTYAIAEHSKSGRLELHIGHRKGCEPFDPMNVRQRLWCGEADLELDSETMMPLKGSFDESGLPAVFEGDTFKSFHFDEEFQTVQQEGSREPLLLPSRIKVTWETEKAKVVVESRFKPRSR